MRGAGLVALVVVAGACSEAPRPADPWLWTLFDVHDLYAAGAAPTDAIATGAGLPGGVPLRAIASSDGALTVLDTNDGYGAAYVTTEVWTYFDRVWIQPMYVMATMGPDGTPVAVVASDGRVHPVFSVGPQSGFYSPFWQTFYVELTDASEAAALTTVRAIFDSGHPLRPGPGRTVSLVPDGTVDVVASPKAGAVSLRTGSGWLDGAPIAFADFGPLTFAWDREGVVAETPLYHFVFTDADGEIQAAGIPTVAGQGPPGSNAQVPVLGGVPRYPAYWRLYTVHLPPDARVFLPPPVPPAAPLLPDLRQRLQTIGFPLIEDADYPAGASGGEADRYVGQVLLNRDCFATTPFDLESCAWLSTQKAIEHEIDPGAVARTEVTVTCPIIAVDGKAVEIGGW